MRQDTLLKGKVILEIVSTQEQGCSGVPRYLETLVEAQAKASYEEGRKAGKAECAKTHFKPDWKIGAQDIKEAMEEARQAGIKTVVEWIKSHCFMGTEVGKEFKAKLKEWGMEG